MSHVASIEITPESRMETIDFLTEINGERALTPRAYGAHRRLADADRISPEAEAEAETYCEMTEAFWGARSGPGNSDKTRIVHRQVMAAGWLRLADQRIGALGRQLMIGACVLCYPMREVGRVMPGAPPAMPETAGLPMAEKVIALSLHAVALSRWQRRQADRAEAELIRTLRRLANEDEAGR